MFLGDLICSHFSQFGTARQGNRVIKSEIFILFSFLYVVSQGKNGNVNILIVAMEDELHE